MYKCIECINGHESVTPNRELHKQIAIKHLEELDSVLWSNYTYMINIWWKHVLYIYIYSYIITVKHIVVCVVLRPHLLQCNCLTPQLQPTQSLSHVHSRDTSCPVEITSIYSHGSTWHTIIVNYPFQINLLFVGLHLFI